MTALHQVVLLTFFTSFACVICTNDEEPWVIIKEMGHIGYQIKSVTKNESELRYVSLIQAPIPTTTENGEDLKLVSTREDGLSAVYEITKVTSKYFQMPVISLTSNTESLEVKLSPYTVFSLTEQTDFAFNDCMLQVEKWDQAESTIYKMTARNCVRFCEYSTTIGKNTASGFQKIRKRVDQRKYVSMYPFMRFKGNDRICSITVNRAALQEDGVEVMSLKFLIEFDGGDWGKTFLYFATYGFNLI
ncbi:uncharacterized protein LOC111103523 [Crassostrea virginica]|uniref:Uncharacterized protein LOC111103239 n=1 Tax=Crassostrea virginica TaxID=6565 RepID=A0A8B8AKG3_CRAVI|nr:uncharacterized protein LOC111103239 [Crassostrea virginica]